MQFGRYIGNFVQGDFGPSFQYKDFNVSELIWQGFQVSWKLGLAAMVIAFLIGVTVGSLAALRQNSAADYATMAVAMTGIAIPNFVMAPVLTLVFGLYLSWLPVGGWGDGDLQHAILPITALALPQVAVIARITRGSMIEVLRSNYVRTARAKGLSSYRVVTRHALRAGLLPLISYLGPAIAIIATGSLVVEQIFSIPGIGRYFVQGALNRDYTLVMGVVIFYAGFIILLNLVADILYRALDPRVRYD
jgi:oligopeptide transport system permease protein